MYAQLRTAKTTAGLACPTPPPDPHPLTPWCLLVCDNIVSLDPSTLNTGLTFLRYIPAHLQEALMASSVGSHLQPSTVSQAANFIHKNLSLSSMAKTCDYVGEFYHQPCLRIQQNRHYVRVKEQ